MHDKTLTIDNVARYYYRSGMIQGFASKDLERLWNRERLKHLPPDIQRAALRKLLMLDAAADLQDLRVPPGNRLERLMGSRAGQYSIRINDQWRICFRWQDGNAYDVEITDYHSTFQKT